MNIGILTFHRSINYGAYMQAYALSSTIQARYPNHVVEIIDFEYLKKHNSYRRPIKHFPFGVEYYIKYTRFQNDLKRLKLSSESFISDKLNQLVEFLKSHYDVLIVGSDAVWAFQGKMPLENPYWLMGKELNSIAKFSYAASAFSTNFQLVTEGEKQFIREQLKDFVYVGVRDSATKSFIEGLGLPFDIYLNHDPTFFLEPAANIELGKRVLRRNFVNIKKPSISFMTREAPHMNEIREKLYNQFNLLHFNIRDSNRKDFYDTRCRYLFNVSPYEWYNVYGLMTLNITSFFHGACLALVNHVPTIVIDDSETEYISKYAQLMIDMGLTDRLFYKGKTDLNTLFCCIDDCLNNREREIVRIKASIEREKKKSESFFSSLDKTVL